MTEEAIVKSWERLWRWAKRHPFAVTTAAVLMAALLLPYSRLTTHPPADLDADETPLFI